MEDCIFCKIIAGDMPAQKIYENDDVLAFLDIRPINPGHALIIPKNHSENMLAADQDDLNKVMDVIKTITPKLLKVVEADSFNLGVNTGRAAGQVVFHTHFHVIPRFPTDNHKHWEGSDEHQDLNKLAEKIRAEL